MKAFKSVIKEMNFNLNTLVIFDALIDAVLVLLVFYLLLMLFSLNEWVALFPSIMFLIVFLYLRTTQNKARIVEKKYASLNEKLRTAVDNIKLENPIIEELQSEVMDDMKQVRVSSFINQKRTSYKILMIVALCFAIIILAAFNIHFNPFDLIKKPQWAFIMGGEGAGNESQLGNIIVAGLGSGNEDIYGGKSVAKLGDEELSIEIKQLGYEVGDVRDVSESEQREFEETFPEEVFAESSATYQENIPKEELELVKNYFKKVAQS